MQIPNLSEAEIELLLQNLTPAQLTELETLLDVEAGPRITFEEYVNMALGYLPDGWQLDLIRRLQSVVGTKRRRILIHAPPRVGKSTIVRLFAAYMLGVNPLERVKYVCYNIERATEHSKAIRALVQDKTYKTYFPHTTFPKLMPSSAWYTIQRLARRDAEPSFQPLGLVTGFVGSGADCLVKGTMVATPNGEVPIETIVPGDIVLGYNIEDGTVTHSRVCATRVKKSSRRIIKISPTLSCTSDHLVYEAGRGYTKAEDLLKRRTANVLALQQDVPIVRCEGAGCREDMQTVSAQGDQQGPDGDLLVVQEGLHEDALRCSETREEGPQGPLLQCGMLPIAPRGEERGEVRSLQDPHSEQTGGEILFQGVHKDGSTTKNDRNLPKVRNRIRVWLHKARLLRENLRGRGAFKENGGCGELQIPSRSKLLQAIQGNEAADYGTGRPRLRTVRSSGNGGSDQPPVYQRAVVTRRTSYRSCCDEQQSRESNHALQLVSPSLSRVTEQVVSPAYDGVSPLENDVYDIQVEGTNNFFAGGILVHNCLLIDDPYSDAKDAMSTIYNESVRIFWQETTKPRILDGNVIVMFHRYSDIDFIAMLIEEGGWEQWIYSAIAEDSSDILGREIGEQLTPRFGEDYFYNVRDQIPASTWEAQFQGRPYPAGGGLIKKEWFEIVNEAPPMRPQYIFKNDLNEYLNTIVMGVDLAVSSKNSADYTVAFPVGISNKGNFYVFRPYRAQAEWPDARKGINDRANEMNVRTIGMEANATQKAMADDLRHATKKNIIKVQPLTDKEARCRMWTPLAEMGRIILVEDGSGWTTECLVEFAAFPKGKNDDRIDALGGALAVAGSGRWGEKLDITSAFKLT